MRSRPRFLIEGVFRVLLFRAAASMLSHSSTYQLTPLSISRCLLFGLVPKQQIVMTTKVELTTRDFS
jgi:hypothetical protein